MEAESLRQIEAQLEKKRQEADLKIKLEVKQKEQLRLAQQEANRIAEQENQQRKKEIKKICEERKIKSLVHFTNVENLPSILKYGLISKKQLEKMNLEFKFNDQLHLEEQPEAICLSVSFPNYKMFYKYRCKNKLGFDRTGNWVVLALSPQILWEIDCKFYKENAASNYAKNNEAHIDMRQSSAFKQMFQDYCSDSLSIKRSNLNIPGNFTTHPQAEVLALSSIPVNYIQSVYFYSKVIAEEWLSLNTPQQGISIKFYYSDYYFKPRQDYEFWKL